MKKFLYLLSIPIVCLILAMAPYISICAASAITHTHDGSCYGTAAFYCNSNHSISKKTENDGSLKHCYTCNAQRSHLLVSYYASCQYVSGTYFTRAEYICSLCGSCHSRWGPGEGHNVERQELTCSIVEGTTMGTLSVSTIQTGWTNQNVTLQASVNKLHNAFSLGANPYSWDKGYTWTSSSQHEVSQNGIYLVQAKDSRGKVVGIGITVWNIDKTPPVIEGVDADTSGMTKTEISVAVRAADAEASAGQGASGLADAAYSADGGSSWQSSPVFLLKEGTAYELVVRDKAGNETRKSLSRSQFPYPPEPEKPKPEETPSDNTKPDDTSQSGSNNSGNDIPGDNSASGGSGQQGNNSSGNGGSGQQGNNSSGNGGSSQQGSNNSGNGSSGQSGNSSSGSSSSAGVEELPANENTGNGSGSDSKRQPGNKGQTGNVKQPDNKGKTHPDILENSKKNNGNSGHIEPDLQQALERREKMLWVEKDIMVSANSPMKQKGWNGTDNSTVTGTKQPVKVERQDTDKNNTNIERKDRQELNGQAGADSKSQRQGEDILQGSLLSNRHSSGLSSAGKAAASMLALGTAAAVLIARMGQVTVYCYRADRRYTKLGRVKVRKTGNGYEARISGRILQKASTGKYRIAVHRFLRRSSKNTGFTVITPKRELELSLEEFVDFAL